MSVTPNFSWPLIQPTDFVTDLPADLEALADDIDADVWAIKGTADAALPETIIDAAGDLIYGSAADTAARLPIGTAGQVLTVNSGATAPEWGSAGGWSPNLTLLNAGGTAMTGSTTITVNVSSYDYYFIFIKEASSANASADLWLRLNGDSGANYGYTYVAKAGTQVDATSTSGAGQIFLAEMGADAANEFSAMVSVLGGKGTGLKSITFAGHGQGSTTNDSTSGVGYYSGSSAITSISAISNSGNFDAGTLFIYGG